MAFTQSGIHVNLWDAKCFVSVTRQFVFDSAPVALWITDMHVKIKKAPGKKVAPWRLLGACAPFFTLAPQGVDNSSEYVWDTFVGRQVCLK